MDATKDKSVRARVPLITLLVVGSALLVAAIPGAAPWFVYDRVAILRGELWRLFTGSWVHFSTSHLICDALAFGVAGWMIESQRIRHFAALCLVAPVTIGVGVFVFQSDLSYFGGLSGLAVAAVGFLLLNNRRSGISWAIFRSVLGALFITKIAVDWVTPNPLFARFEGVDVISATGSHIAGAVVALIVSLMSRQCTLGRGARRSAPQEFTNQGLSSSAQVDTEICLR